MKLRNVVAVAALAVVGAVGMASAQGIWEDIRDGNKLTGEKTVDPVKMNVTHTIKLEATMTGSGPGVSATGVALEDIQTNETDFALGPTAVADIASFGMLTVKTNYPSWDIGLTTRGGGRLSTNGDLNTPEPVCDPDIITWENFPEPTITPGPCVTPDPFYEEGVVLTYKDAGTDTELELMVAIGVINFPTSGSGNPTAAAHTVIADAALQASKQGAGVVPISFVEQLTGNTANNTGVVVGSRPIDAVTGEPNAAIDLGFGVTDEVGQWFYISVGVDEDNFAALGGNPEGEYYETLTFTLYANY